MKWHRLNPPTLRTALGRCTAMVLVSVLLTSPFAHTAAATISLPPRPRPVASGAALLRQTVSEAALQATTVEEQLRVFEQLWDAVNDSYVYPDFNGYDWAAARPAIEAQIREGMTAAAFYDLMRELVDNLKDDHSIYLSPDEALDEEQEYAGDQEYVGIGIYVELNRVRGYIYILSVYAASPAEQAGLKPHDHILEIDGEPSVNAEGESQDDLMRGPENTPVTLKVRTPGQPPRTVEIIRRPVVARERIIYRMLPTPVQTTTSSTPTPPSRIGYMLVPTFFETNMGRRMRDALRALMKQGGGRLDGLVVDMRINGGGSYPQLSTALSFFTRGTMGSLVNRAETRQKINIRSQSIGNSQTVPLVVLIGPATASYAEVYAGALQANGRARLAGKPSAGNIETLLRHDFDDGSIAWIAEETFVLPDGTGWEGVGLRPDISVGAAWDEMTDENDPVIAAAVEALQAKP